MGDPIPRIIMDSIHDSLLQLSWDKEGKEILAKTKQLTIEDKLKLKYLITLGTPEAYRGKLWLFCSKAKEYKANNALYYQRLVKLTANITSQSEKQINCDLLRSNRKNDKAFISKAKSILLSYSIRNTSIGYCQGFHCLIECLLSVVEDEEDTFWLFCMLIEDILPLNFYSELSGIIIDTTLIETFLQKYFPSLSEFFKRNDLGVKNFIHKWLVTLFTENFLNETTCFIWDYLFLEGNIVLIKSCLAVFCVMKTYLMQYDNNMEELFVAMLNQTKEIKKSNPTLIHALSLKQFEFDDAYVERTRSTLTGFIIDNINKDNKEKFNKKAEMTDKGEGERRRSPCNVEWPYCVYETMLVSPSVVDYLVLNFKRPPTSHWNYFFQEDFTQTRKKEEGDDDVMIERRAHFCQLKEDKGGSETAEVNDSSDATCSSRGFKLYRRISKDINYMTVRNKVMEEFTPKPYLDYESIQSS